MLLFTMYEHANSTRFWRVGFPRQESVLLHLSVTFMPLIRLVAGTEEQLRSDVSAGTAGVGRVQGGNEQE